MTTFIITNNYGTPFNGFYWNALEYGEIFSFSNACFSSFKSREEAVQKIAFFKKCAEEERKRWGELTYKQVLNLIDTLLIRKRTI